MTTAPSVPLADAACEPEFGPDSPNWGTENARRAWLIHKKADEGLSPDEQFEFTLLQRKFAEAAKRHFPSRKFSDDEMAAVNRVLSQNS